MADKPTPTHRMETVRVRSGAPLTLAPDDRVFYMRSDDDLSSGGTWHWFAVLRSTRTEKQQ